MRKEIFFVGTLFLVLGLLIAPSYSDTAVVNIISSSTLGNVSSTPANILVNAGNTYAANVSADSSTSKWAGVYGTVENSLVLGDSNGNTIYNWGGSPISTIFFVPKGANVDLTNLIPANSTIVQQVSSLDDGSADSWSNTFIGITSASNGLIPANTSYTITNPTSSGFATFSLAYNDTSGESPTYDLVWAGNVTKAKPTFDGNTANYQVLLPAGTYEVYLGLGTVFQGV